MGRNQTGTASAAPIGAGQRISPFALPARFTVGPSGNPRALPGSASVYLDESIAIVKRRLSGLPLTLSVPVSGFEGVAVRIEPMGEGLAATIELRHRDPSITLPLGTAEDMTSAAADWQAWARRLGLPMLVVEADGALRHVLPDGAMATAVAKPTRRKRSTAGRRRPRFLARRKIGAAGPMPVLRGAREIIARS